MAGVRRTKARDGRYHEYYRFWFMNWKGQRQWGTGTSRRAETLSIAKKLEEEHRQIRLGYRPLSSLYEQSRDIQSVVGEYLEWGEAQGGRGGRPWAPRHAASRRRHLPWWVEQLRLRCLQDMQGILPRVESALRKLKQAGRSGKTITNYAESLSAFVDWCVARDYLRDDPLKGLKRFDATPESRRRALTLEEVRRLLEVAPNERKVLYSVALSTGLRARELASLKVKHLDLKNGGLCLDASWTKNRKADFQPVPLPLLRLLAERTCSLGVNAPLLSVPTHTARSLDRDLEAAEIPKDTEEGRLDFHALRTTYATLLLDTGAHPKEVQSLMRHASPEMTMNVYARTRPERLRAAADLVGDKVISGSLCATGVQQGEPPPCGAHPKLLSLKKLRKHKHPSGMSFDSRRLHHVIIRIRACSKTSLRLASQEGGQRDWHGSPRGCVAFFEFSLSINISRQTPFPPVNNRG